MKVGSLVECVDNDFDDIEDVCIVPKKGSIYHIREIYSDSDGDFVTLEEIVNPPIKYLDGYIRFGEPQFDIDAFRELLPPIANVEQHIKENTLEPELI